MKHPKKHFVPTQMINPWFKGIVQLNWTDAEIKRLWDEARAGMGNWQDMK